MIKKPCVSCKWYTEIKSTIADKEYSWHECTHPEQKGIKTDVKPHFSCKHWEKA